ncbi:unnamed protein product [Choristocarpus tenellus]
MPHTSTAIEEQLDPRNLQLTTHAEPKILMEVMPASLVVSLLVLTYLVFAGGCGLIIRSNLVGTSTAVVPNGGHACPWNDAAAMSSSSAPAPSAIGCTEYSPQVSSYMAVFNATFTDLDDLYGSVALHTSFQNGSVLPSLPYSAVVDVTLEACVDAPMSEGVPGPTVNLMNDCAHGWLPVLTQVGI